MPPILLWVQDNFLRLHDNPALHAAVSEGQPVLPVYIRQDDIPWAVTGAAQIWLEHALKSLQQDLRKLKSDLLIYSGDPASIFSKLSQETGSQVIYTNQCYEPAAQKTFDRLKRALPELEWKAFAGSLLIEPETLTNQSGKPYQVFTPFWRRCLQEESKQTYRWDAPLPAPAKIPAPDRWPTSLTIDQLKLSGGLQWEKALCREWQVGERHALAQMERFIENGAAQYEKNRDSLWPQDLSSRLSAHLRFGEISPRRIYQTLEEHPQLKAQAFVRQLGWREFSYYLLHYFSETADQPLKPLFNDFPWEENVKLLQTWQTGQTGYPIIDAGMRQLWRTGFLPNRVRMLVASFLVKDLFISWQEGARWFWDTLADADLANNTMGWQWVAGCGADASPFFRIFNPITQAEKFDPTGQYVRRWVPELAALSTEWVHKPWQADKRSLRAANVALGESYPEPVVSHEVARSKALAAYKALQSSEKAGSTGTKMQRK